MAKNNIWAGKSDNYYSRKVVNPFRILASKVDKTYVNVKDSFSYKFITENQVGVPVFAFLNLPEGLVGDSKTGSIVGKFKVPGIYTIGV